MKVVGKGRADDSSLDSGFQILNDNDLLKEREKKVFRKKRTLMSKLKQTQTRSSANEAFETALEWMEPQP